MFTQVAEQISIFTKGYAYEFIVVWQVYLTSNSCVIGIS